jgi:hypothetical protein
MATMVAAGAPACGRPRARCAGPRIQSFTA